MGVLYDRTINRMMVLNLVKGQGSITRIALKLLITPRKDNLSNSRRLYSSLTASGKPRQEVTLPSQETPQSAVQYALFGPNSSLQPD